MFVATVVVVLLVVRDAARPRVILYGDSLSAQSSADFRRFVGDEGGADVTLRAFGGTAPCDWLGTMHEDADAISPDAVVLQFAGNAFTPCMRRPDGQELTADEIRARYASDLTEATHMFAREGVRVYLVTTPAGVGLRDPVQLSDVYRDLARRRDGVRVVDGGTGLRDEHGAYPPTLPCLPHEGPERGCEGGRISVRGGDGFHFCDDPGGALACPSYSSGAWRFAATVAAPVRRDLRV